MADPALNIANRTLYHGDNLPFLRGINSGTIHLIATDPPFNKGRDFHATPDSLAAGARFEDRWGWDRDVHEEWVDAIQDDWPAVWQVIEAARSAAGEDMAAFLCWLGVRLLEMHRVLRDDGSLYLHCDQTASHYIKAVMDAIFGHDQFRNDVVWRRATSHNDGNQFGRITDHILFYTKGTRWTWNGDEIAVPRTEEEIARDYPSDDEDGRGRYRSSDLTAAGQRPSGESSIPWKDYDVDARGRHWSPPREGGLHSVH